MWNLQEKDDAKGEGGFTTHAAGWQVTPAVPQPQIFGGPGFHPQQQQTQLRHTPQEQQRNLTGPHAVAWREYYRKQQPQQQQPQQHNAPFGGQPQLQQPQVQHTPQEKARNLTGAHAAQWRTYYRNQEQQQQQQASLGAPLIGGGGHGPPRVPVPPQAFGGQPQQPQQSQLQHDAAQRQQNLEGPHGAQWREYYRKQMQQQQQQQQPQVPSYAAAAGRGRRPSFAGSAGPATGAASAAAQPNNQWAWGTTAQNSGSVPAGGGVSFKLGGGGGGAQKTSRPSQFGGDREPAAFLASQSHPPAKKRKTQSAAAGLKEEPWPPSLKSYVARAFAQCNAPGINAEAARNRVETLLKAKIVAASAKGPLTRTDWNSEPLLGAPTGVPSYAAGYGGFGGNNGAAGGGGGPADDGQPKAVPPKSYICKICKVKGHFIFDCSKYFGKDKDAKQKAALAKQQKQAAKAAKKQAKAAAATAASASADVGYGSASAASRAARFGTSVVGGSKAKKKIKWNNADRVQLAASGPITGTCTELEKGYLRLVPGMEPEPAEVRPLLVLKEAFKHVVKRWKKEQKYKWFWAQLKSIRQDMSVQHIRDDFTAKVYEMHARVALEQKDTPEFTQCLGQLRDLYTDGIKGAMKEFFCYRLLYTVFTHSHDEYLSLYVEVSNGSYPFSVDDPHVKHAIAVYEAYALGNYHKLFVLYKDAPNMGGFLMDLYIERERKKAMLKITQAYRPTVPIEFVFKTLSFEDKAECKEFLVEQKLPLAAKDATLLDCKPAFLALKAAQAAAASTTAAWAK